jgi:tRNA (guanine37-N1)-methyltransferase
MLKIDVLTLFPKMFEGILDESIIKRAQEKKLVKIKVHNLRDWSADKHKKADDKPYGGGPGMILSCQPIFDAVRKLAGPRSRVILLSPQGKRLNQTLANRLAKLKHLILICGHYEGVDDRVRKAIATDEISIGEYVLTGGELPAMVLIDAAVRMIPGVLGNRESAENESFQGDLLEYPQYTRPRVYKGLKVPGVLLTGDHEKIEQWRYNQALKKTRQKVM